MRDEDRPPASRARSGPTATGEGAEPALAEIAGRQHGVVSAAQLRRLGLDRSAVGRRVTAGRLHPPHCGVYAVGHRSLSPHGRYLAAVLACGPGAVLSHRSAGRLWWLRPGSERLEVTAPRGRVATRRVRLYRSRLAVPADFTVLEGIPVTSVARTLLDLAAVVDGRALARAIDRAERVELFDLAAVNDTLVRARSRRGAAALRQAVTAWEPRRTRRCRVLCPTWDDVTIHPGRTLRRLWRLASG